MSLGKAKQRKGVVVSGSSRQMDPMQYCWTTKVQGVAVDGDETMEKREQGPSHKGLLCYEEKLIFSCYGEYLTLKLC